MMHRAGKAQYRRSRLNSNVRPHVNSAARLAAHFVSFFTIAWLLRSESVESRVWLVAYAAGVAFLCFAPQFRIYPRSAKLWALVAFYSSLLSALFFGTNFALEALAGSVKPRAPIPAIFGGLELLVGVNYLGRSTTTILAGGRREFSEVSGLSFACP